MKYIQLGNAGLKVSRIGIGCLSFGNNQPWMAELEEAIPIVKKALDLGINLFDTADVYSQGRSEEIVGEILKDRRQEVVIATKVYFETGKGVNDRGLSRYHIMNGIKSSLRRLQTDHVDLYQVHRWDYDTPIEETLLTLNDLVRTEKVRYVGASNMYSWQFAKTLDTSRSLGIERFASMQAQYNVCFREEEREMVPLCKSESIGLLAWSPLAGGFLSGEFRRGQAPDTTRYKTDKSLQERYFRPEDFDVLDRVYEVAKEKGVTPAQVALAWLLQKGVAAPLIGATKAEQIEEAVGALDVKLTQDDIDRMDEHYKPHVLGRWMKRESELRG